MPSDGELEPTPGGSDADRTLVHRGPVFGVRRVDYLDRDGRSVRKEFMEHPGAITVIPEESDGTILMVRVGRIAVGRFLLEFCAGKLESGELPADAAARELEEEVGRTAAEVRPLGSFLTSRPSSACSKRSASSSSSVADSAVRSATDSRCFIASILPRTS